MMRVGGSLRTALIQDDVNTLTGPALGLDAARKGENDVTLDATMAMQRGGDGRGPCRLTARRGVMNPSLAPYIVTGGRSLPGFIRLDLHPGLTTDMSGFCHAWDTSSGV